MARGYPAVLHRRHPQAASKAKYMIDVGAEAARARCTDLLAWHPLYPQVQLWARPEAQYFGPTNSSNRATASRRATEMTLRREKRHATPS
jgi:hypothetical protein